MNYEYDIEADESTRDMAKVERLTAIADQLERIADALEDQEGSV